MKISVMDKRKTVYHFNYDRGRNEDNELQPYYDGLKQISPSCDMKQKMDQYSRTRADFKHFKSHKARQEVADGPAVSRGLLGHKLHKVRSSLDQVLSRLQPRKKREGAQSS